MSLLSLSLTWLCSTYSLGRSRQKAFNSEKASWAHRLLHISDTIKLELQKKNIGSKALNNHNCHNLLYHYWTLFCRWIIGKHQKCSVTNSHGSYTIINVCRTRSVYNWDANNLRIVKRNEILVWLEGICITDVWWLLLSRLVEID